MRRCVLLMVILACVVFWSSAAKAGEAQTGKAIYESECARCHGPTGQGTRKTTRSLAGDKSPSQLATFIHRSMPDDDPGSCKIEDCQKVAAYIYDAFYSTDAQARLNPPRLALSHLTVGQYRSSVADLIGSFRPILKRDSRPGLRGEYFNARDARNDKRLIDRIDPTVNFDFGTEGPKTDSDDKQFNPDQFCVRWTGSVFAPETGEYEFVVQTDQALRLFVNERQTPLIEGIIKSGTDTEYRAPMYLIAGRSYSIRLEIYKGRHLSDKKKGKQDPKPTPETVALKWKAPNHRIDDLIPSRLLSPAMSAEAAIIKAPFPPDDRSYGWERGTAVSKEWFSATANAALDVAGYVVSHLPELSGAAEDAKNRETKLRDFCRAFAERAFRRPLTDAEKQLIVDRQFEGTTDLDQAVKRVVIRVMMSAEFLYPGVAGGSSGYQSAARLALVLWDSLPDDALLAAAKRGELSSPQQIAHEAQRMMDDPRAKLKLHQFLLAWLKVDQSPELVKDQKRFPDFDPAVAADLRTSLELFLDDIAFSEKADFRQFFRSEDIFLNSRLAKFYGTELPEDSDFTRSKLDSDARAGVLTHPYMMAAFAYPGESSPIHRGVFIIRGMLGVTLRPPANATFTPFAPEKHPGLTTRQRITLQTSETACVSCHAVINSFGFTLEKFDSVGRFRDKENGKPVDVSGSYDTRDGSTEKFAGPGDLAAFLANSHESHDAFAQQMFQQFTKQTVRAYGLDKPARLHEAFTKADYNIRKLLMEIAVIASQPAQ